MIAHLDNGYNVRSRELLNEDTHKCAGSYQLLQKDDLTFSIALMLLEPGIVSVITKQGSQNLEIPLLDGMIATPSYYFYDLEKNLLKDVVELIHFIFTKEERQWLFAIAGDNRGSGEYLEELELLQQEREQERNNMEYED